MSTYSFYANLFSEGQIAGVRGLSSATRVDDGEESIGVWWERVEEQLQRTTTDFDTVARIGEAMRDATGGFTYRTVSGMKEQLWTVNINNINDAIVLRELVRGNYPVGSYKEAYNKAALAFDKIGWTPPAAFAYSMLERSGAMRLLRFEGASIPLTAVVAREPLYEPTTTQRAGRETIRNPITGRSLFVGSRTYKEVFGKMRLRAVIVRPEHIFKTKEYKIEEFCVPSYLKTYLTKKQYRLISEDLDKNPAPTYPELTDMMNSINIGLNVYIIDGENIQTQKEQYNKNLDILIRAGHMYVLYKTLYQKTKKTIEITYNEYDDIINLNDLSAYTEKSFIFNQIKYKIKQENNLPDFINYNSTFSQININFYLNSKIRPTAYFNKEVRHKNGVDINACYANILRNKNYMLPVQTGREITTEYKGGDILPTSFYYVEFIEPDGDTIAIFGSKCWIMGTNLINLDIKANIIYEHIVKESRPTHHFGYVKKDKYEDDDEIKYDDIVYIGHEKATDEEIKEAEEKGVEIIDYFELIQYTGVLAKFKKYDVITYPMIDIKDEKGEIVHNHEQDALLIKYQGNASNSYGGITLNNESYKKTSGIYAYMGIVSYAKYQLFKIAKYVREIKGNVNIAMIKTDYIGFDVRITREDLEKINKRTIKRGFSAKIQFSNYSFIYREHAENSVQINAKTLKHYGDDNDKIKRLLDKNKSFFLNGRGGYGKTYTIKNTIIPHLESTNKKYILASTTIKNAQEIGGIAIQSLLFTKGMNHWKLIKEIEEKGLKDTGYIICDEASQMTADTITTLQYIKDKLNINIICSGDQNQCSSVDSDGQTWINSYAFWMLNDFKQVNLEWKDVGRYSKEYDDFLNKILETSKQTEKIKIIYKYFKDQTIKDGEEDKDIKNIVYTHEKGKSLKSYNTVHSVQGESIDETHNIYEIEKMPRDVLYTALSRTTKKEHIRIIKKN